MADIKLASRLATLEESATLALNARAKQLAAEGRTIYNLTAGELATSTPEYIQKAVAGKLDQNKYTAVAGMPELRIKLAAYANGYYGLEWIKPENVVVTGGAKPALYATMLALLDPGDEVVVPTPVWNTYEEVIRLAEGVPVQVPLTDEYDLDVPAIKAKISSKTKLIMINSPHNPTGAIFSRASLEQLAIALKGSNIVLLSDDIYSKLVYQDDFTLVPTIGFDNLVIVSGFSKSQALTGWRIGYVIAEQALASAITGLLSHITSNAPVLSQYAALAALERGDQPPQETIDALKRQRQLVVDGLSDAGVKHNVPGGAFYIFLDVREFTDDSAKWCERLLVETGVALVPGEAFAAPGFARLTFVTDEGVLKNGLAQIKAFITKGDPK
jgi:aspartate aminotransferase